MSILSGPEIIRIVQATKAAQREGTPLPYPSIDIEPFDASAAGPNSLDVRLGEWLDEIEDVKLDLMQPIKRYKRHRIPEEGFILLRGIGFLGHTLERITCHGVVPWLDGRSSVGRRFLQIHQTAGRGDDGFDGAFTIELLATHRPVIVYAGLKVAQVTFFPLVGERKPYVGGYNGQMGPMLPKPLTR